MRVLFPLVLMMLASTAIAEVKETPLNYTYYTAQANPSHSLREILNTSSPIREGGKLFHGYTKWQIGWNFRWFEKANGRCKLTLVTTEYSANIQLPELNGGSIQQRQQFDRFLPALRSHELGHYSIGKDAAKTVDRKLLSLPEMSSCRELESTANDLGNRILDEYRGKEKQYDISTSHGKTQGAWLDN